MEKEKAIVDNLNNERVATLVEKEFKLSEKRKELRKKYINYPQLWAVVIECNEQDKEFIRILEDNSFIEATGSIKVVSLDFIKKKAGDLK